MLLFFTRPPVIIQVSYPEFLLHFEELLLERLLLPLFLIGEASARRRLMPFLEEKEGKHEEDGTPMGGVRDRPTTGSVAQTTQDEKYFCSDTHEIGLVPRSGPWVRLAHSCVCC